MLACLIEGLAHPSTEAAAAIGLGELGPFAKTAVPQLARVAKNRASSYLATEYAAQALAKIGGDGLDCLVEMLLNYRAISGLKAAGEAAAPLVVKSLKIGNEEQRIAATMALPRLSLKGNSKEIIRTALVATLTDDSWRVRIEAIRAFEKFDDDGASYIPAIADGLKDPVRAVRRQSAQSIGKLGPKARTAIPHLIVALKDPSEGVCKDAAFALGKVGPTARQAVPALVEILVKESDTGIRCSAMEGLGGIGAAARSAVPPLIAVLKDSHATPEEQAAAAHSLGGIGPTARAAVPVLRSYLPDLSAKNARAARKGNELPESIVVFGTDPQLAVRLASAIALGRIGDDSENAVLVLWNEIEEKRPLLQLEYLQNLGDFGPVARVVFPKLLTILKGEKTFGKLLIPLLARIGPARVEEVQGIVDLINAAHFFDTENMAMLLAGMGPHNKEATPVLLKALKTSHFNTRVKIIQALGLIGPGAKEATPVLLRCLKENEAYPIQFAAAWSLVQIGAVPKQKTELLEVLQAGARKDNSFSTSGRSPREIITVSAPDDPDMRVLAVGSLLQLRAIKIDEGLPTLVGGLRSESFMVRRYAARVLNELGGDARPALPQLLEAVCDSDWAVRREGAAAAKKIDPKAAAEAGIP